MFVQCKPAMQARQPLGRRQSVRLNAFNQKNAPPSVIMTVGRFTTNVENLHGRLAMLGITGCAIQEHMGNGLTIGQQLTSVTGASVTTAAAVVSAITLGFILHVLNPNTIRRFESDPMVWGKPGFTVGSEILNGRLAMLGFAYAFVSELVSHHNML